MKNRWLIALVAAGFILAAWIDDPNGYGPTEQYQKDKVAVIWVGGEIVTQTTGR